MDDDMSEPLGRTDLEEERKGRKRLLRQSIAGDEGRAGNAMS